MISTPRRHCGDQRAWGRGGAPSALLHDSCGVLPAEAAGVQLVVASLPWGRQQRIPHAAYLPEMVASLARQLPDATFVLISADPATEILASSGLVPSASAAVTSGVAVRCHLTVARAPAATAATTSPAPSTAATTAASTPAPTLAATTATT